MLDHVVYPAEFVPVRHRFGDIENRRRLRETDRAAYFETCYRERGSHCRKNSTIPSFRRIELSPPDARRFTVKKHSIAPFSLGGWTPPIKTKKVSHRT
jgi:hypothetical protein